MASLDASTNDRVLLVEGPDDKSVVRSLCRFNSVLATFCIVEKNGWTNLRKSIPLEVKAEGRTAVGILVDANDSLGGRWQAVAQQLQAAEITAPAQPTTNGTIIPGGPRVGIWVMPDNLSAGELEDFVAGMIPPTDPVWPMSEKYIDGIPGEHRKFSDGKIVRAKVHAWLAARRRPRQMGTAIEAGDLDTNVAQVQMFLEWLRDLFGSPAPEST